jgi:hypothetical protein
MSGQWKPFGDEPITDEEIIYEAALNILKTGWSFKSTVENNIEKELDKETDPCKDTN